MTSPPYYNLRDYGTPGQIGMEETPEKYIESLVLVFREVWHVLRADGTLWINIGDSYATSSGPQPPTNTRNSQGHTEKRVPSGYKRKDLIGIPWLLAFALQKDGWYLRQDIIWHKTNPMPENVRDRCVKSHEYIFLLSKSARYYTDYVALLMSSVTDIISGISYLLIAFVSISLVVSSIMIGIITYISVLERTKEIGILRAVGASKRDVSRVFNAETLIVGLGAGLIGIGVTVLLIFPINAVLFNVTGIAGLKAALPVQGAAVLVAISAVLTLIAGLIPSRLAAKKDPVVALRTE